MVSKKTGKPIGRPNCYAPELVHYVLEKVKTCNVGLEAMCKADDRLPVASVIYEWRSKYPDFAESYLLARKYQAHLLAEQVKDIAEETYKYIYQDADTGAQKIDSGIIALQNMRTKANTWLASRINPSEYGEKKTDAPLNPSDTFTKVGGMVADFNKTNASDV